MAQQTILRLPQVQMRTGLSRSSIYNAVKAGTFPNRIAIGARAVGWDSFAVDAWVADRISASLGRSRGGK